jgi:hypothetical protein
MVAVLLGLAGTATLVAERRLGSLSPGGVDVAALHYNPFTGRLVLDGVRGRDAGGRELFRADRLVARISPWRLLVRPLTVSQAQVTTPRLTLRAGPGFDLSELAAELGAAPSTATSLPVRVEDLVVTRGTLVIEGAGEGGVPLLARDLNVRLSRLTTATVDRNDVAFAVEMVVYGTVLHVTGQPRGGGYALHVRARGLDVAGLVRDVPVAALSGLQQGRGEVDADLLLADGRLLVSGAARVVDLVAVLPGSGAPRLRVGVLSAVMDRFDLASGEGRIARLELADPVLLLPAATAPAALAALLEPLQRRPGLIIRRVAITGGSLALEGDGGARLQRVQLTAHAPERRGDGAWLVSARAAAGPEGQIALDGVLARDLRTLDAVARVQRVALGSWRALTGRAPGWDARVSFDGRLHVALREGEAMVSAAGHAVLADVETAGLGGFRAERIALGIRRLQWPGSDPILDGVVLTRPAFAPPGATSWPRLLVAGNVSVVDGEMREPGRALRDLAVSVGPIDDTGAAHLRLSASTDDGQRLGIDRRVPYDAPAEGGVPLRQLLATIEQAAREAREPSSALPAAALAP